MHRLAAFHVLTVHSRESASKLSGVDREQFVHMAGEMFGGGAAGFEAAVRAFDHEQMAMFKLRLERDGKPEWDVWINTVMDDGGVFPAGKPQFSGIGISQTNVHDMREQRKDLCAEISNALYTSKWEKPDFVDWE